MSQEEVIKELVKKWMKKADKDILTAARELSFEDPITDSVCFHCQQAVEKYLKAYLVFHQKYFTETHNILNLLELCSSIDPSFSSQLSEADKLTDYAIEIRYPDVWLEPDLSDAQEALKIAKEVKEFVLSKIS